MEALIFAFAAVFVILCLIEAAPMITLGTCFLRGRGVDMLEKELSSPQTELNSIDESIISLAAESELKGWFASNSIPSPLCEWYVRDTQNLHYRVLRFSKAHYMLEKKLRELKSTSKKAKHIKF